MPSAQTTIITILQAIIKKYSKLPVKHLLDSYLKLRVITHLSPPTIEPFLDHTLKMSKSDQVIFLKSDRRRKEYVCVVVEHARYLDCCKHLLQIQKVIIMDPSLAQCNNLIYKPVHKLVEVKAVLVQVDRFDDQQLYQSLDCYLSICQLFHAHTHIILSCQQAQLQFEMGSAIGLDSSKEDELEFVKDNGYFRMLDERASRITLDELSEFCSIEHQHWGDVLLFDSGQDGIIIWFTENYFPMLKRKPSLTTQTHNHLLLHFKQDAMGFLMLKLRGKFTQKIKQLNFTTVVFNFKCYDDRWDVAVQEKWEEIHRQFTREYQRKHQYELMVRNVEFALRMCQLLKLEEHHILTRLF